MNALKRTADGALYTTADEIAADDLNKDLRVSQSTK